MFNRNKQKAVVHCCVKNDILKVSSDVQRDIDIIEILNSAKLVMGTEEELRKQGYAFLHFATTFRTVYTNEVVLHKNKRKDWKSYVLMDVTTPLPHKGLDLVMYLSACSVFLVASYKNGLTDELLMHTEHQCIGLYNPSPDFVDPVIYSHVYLDDSSLNTFSRCLTKGNMFVPISTLSEEDAFDKTLIIVEKKEEDNNV